MVEIHSGETALAWLEQQPRQRQIWMATRSALRALPKIIAYADRSRLDVMMLYACRPLLVSTAAATCPEDDLLELKNVAFRVTDGSVLASGGTGSQVIKVCYNAVRSAAFADDASRPAATATMAARVAGTGDMWTQFSKDTEVRQKWYPLWSSTSMPDAMADNWRQLKRELSSKSETWSFWLNWYDKLLNGQAVDWSFIFQLALKLAPEDWQRGAEHIANRIREIEAEFYGGVPLDAERIKERVRELLENRVATADTAEGTGNLIEKAIQEYKDTAPANALPEGLEKLEDLPGQFWRIAAVVRDDSASTEQEAALEAEIKMLHARIAELEREVAKARGLGAKFVETWVNGMAKTLSDKWFLGGLTLGTAFFFGVDPNDLTMNNLKGYINELMTAQPDTPTVPQLPPDYET